MLEKTLQSPLDCKEVKPVIPKRNRSEYSLEELMLKHQYFDHQMRRANSLEKILMLGKTEGERRGQQRMRWLDSITDSVEMNLRKLCGTLGASQVALVVKNLIANKIQ